MADPAHTFAQPHEAASRLHELGLTLELIHQTVAVGLVGRRAATPFHPPSYPGFNQWAETHRALRERLVPLGWKADDSGGFSTVIDPAKTLAITVATGTDRTGRAGYPEPATKYARGALTHAAIETNQQLVIPGFPGVEQAVEEPTRASRVTWILLIHTRHDEVRIELSCPKAVGRDGRVDAWSERILIAPLSAEPILSTLDDDPGPTNNIDVPVEPR